MIVLARLVDSEAREVRKRYENEVTGVERAGYSKIARALFETEGKSSILMRLHLGLSMEQ